MTFNKDAFMSSTVSTPLSTSYENCPEGEYRMMVDDGDKAIDFVEFTAKDGSGRVSHQAVIQCVVLDDGVKAQLGRDKVTVRMQLWLDMKEDGTLDPAKGKNVRLGQFLDALNLNGQPWTWAGLKGKGPFMGKVGQRADKNDPEKKYAEVTRTTKMT